MNFVENCGGDWCKKQCEVLWLVKLLVVIRFIIDDDIWICDVEVEVYL